MSNLNHWQLAVSGGQSGTFAELDITSATVELSSCSSDRASLVWEPDAGIIAADLIPYNSVCTISGDDATFFKGRCRTNPRTATNPAETIRYDIIGPWFDLERITYQQRWKIWNTTTNTVSWQSKSRLILGQAENGTSMSVGQIIADVVAYAASKGALCALPEDTSAWPTIKMPWEEISNLKCADVITRCLAFVPDYKCRFDYTAEVSPEFQLVKRSAATTLSLAIGTSVITEIGGIQPRYDLAVPGVRIHFERNHSYNDTTWESIETQEAGSPDNLDAIEATIPLAGADITTTSAKIVTSELPKDAEDAVDWLNMDWWKEQVPSLANYAALSLDECIQTVILPEDGSTPPALADLEFVLIDGNIPSWLAGAKAARVDIELTCSYTENRPADGKETSRVDGHKITHTLTLTNLVTNTYTRRDGFFAEPAPEGFAAALLAAWSPVQYDGSVVLELAEEVAHIARPGDVLNISGGHASWAAMNAHIQQISYNIETSTITINIGPARNISADNLLSLMRRMRARMLPISAYARMSGKTVDRDNAVEIGGTSPEKHTTETSGSYEYINVSSYNPEAPYNKEIELDPSAITKEDETDTTPVTVKPRVIHSLEVIGGEMYHVKRHYLASDPTQLPAELEPYDPENPAGPTDPDQDHCDQNTHPGSDDFAPVLDPAEIEMDPDHPFYDDEIGADQPDDPDGELDHPAANDCYTTRG